MIRQRRVIPFIGAGFSSGLGLPDWDTLLREVCKEVADIPEYDDIKRCCNGDYLQIAEYLYIKSDRSIGPLRHKLSTLLHPNGTCLDSAPHVELVNLNSQQIYTTNYDEVIEHTFRSLGHPYAFVALPKHIAAANTAKTQVVKYHGDLRFDSSLVLTESSYYSRLEFESPMDLKFRSDLLGQSVLFIGYSFRDINIRIIWFKLMEMMRDVPEADRPSSYIVRFERNEVLEDLYSGVGIKTIYLDPDGNASTPEERTQLLSRFMLDLTVRVSKNGLMPESTTRMFVSRGLLDRIGECLMSRKPGPLHSGENELLLAYLDQASMRTTPTQMIQQVDQAIGAAARSTTWSPALAGIAKWAIKFRAQSSDNNENSAVAIIRALCRTTAREIVLGSSEINWSKIWSTSLSDSDAEFFVKMLQTELEHHKGFGSDEDLAYTVDIAKRILDKTLVVARHDRFADQLADLIKLASDMYPSIATTKPNLTGPTDLSSVLLEIEQSASEIPF